MAPSVPRRRRARPVADVPIELLVPRSADLAKGWLLALLEDAPLGAAPALLAGDLVNEGPKLCEAALRALGDDRALACLEAGGSRWALAGRVGELVGADGDAAAIARAVDGLAGVLWASLRHELSSDDAGLVADLAERLALVCGRLRTAALTVRPVRSSPDPLWMDALEEEIARSGASPLSLLLAELEDDQPGGAAEGAVPATAAFAHFAQAVRRAMRRHDILVSETDGRAWIIARRTGRAEAHALAARVAEAVRNGASSRGGPRIARVGIAVLGEDGGTADALIAAARKACTAPASTTTVAL